MRVLIVVLSAFVFTAAPWYTAPMQAQSTVQHSEAASESAGDSVEHRRRLLKEASVVSSNDGLKLTIRNVDITRFPEVSVIVEAFNHLGQPLDTLRAEELTVVENGRVKSVISVEKVSLLERVPVDFVFVIDVTGSMQQYIDAVRENISTFTSSLVRRGIDYRMGLTLFSDVIEKSYHPTDDVVEFLGWLSTVNAKGGLDEKENALAALEMAADLSFRPAANRVVVLITDAPYHQKGDIGSGITRHTTKSIVNLLFESDVRAFCIVPAKLKEYREIAEDTRGTIYSIHQPFANILDNFSDQLTNLYALKYRSDEEALPDSIEIGILDQKHSLLVKRTIPIVEIGRKLIIENLLFGTNSAGLPPSVPELDLISEFMERKPNVVIQVEGHTDSVGGARLNKVLSQKRARAVKAYLVNRGIKSKRIKTRGYGLSRPIASNATEFGRKLNRRTEIVITER